MNQLQYNTGAFRHPRAQAAHSPQQRIFGIAFAALVEVGIVYALIVNIAPREAPPVLPPFNGYILPDDKIVEPLPPPKPPTFEAPPIADPITPVVVLEYTPPPSATAITVPTPREIPLPPKIATVIPTPPPIYAPARAIVATHTTPEYPPLARRLGQQGTLRLKLTVSEQGTVSDAIVVNSSGFPNLDSAAVDWVKQYWRYEPAKQGSRAVRAEVQAVVQFKLQ